MDLFYLLYLFYLHLKWLEIIYCFSLNHSTAVSYTHLDVYKRQALYGLKESPRAWSVSYTHLDVYKRQGIT